MDLIPRIVCKFDIILVIFDFLFTKKVVENIFTNIPSYKRKML